MRPPRKVLLVIADYTDERQQVFDLYYSPRNKAYCAHHGFEYVVSKGDGFRRAKNWCKVKTIQRMMQQRELVDGDTVVVLDADVVIVNGNPLFDTKKSFAYAIDNYNSHSTAFFILNVNDWTRSMLDRWLDEDLYWRHCEEPAWTGWYEQGAWYTIAGIEVYGKPHLNRPHFGWHSAVGPDVTMTLEELHTHVELRGTEWCTAMLDDESDNPGAISSRPYYVYRTRREDVILRHFCGGQAWRYDYACRPLFPSPDNPAVSLFPEHEPPASPLESPGAGVVPESERGVIGGVPGSGINVTFRRSSS